MLYAIAVADRKMYTARRERHIEKGKRGKVENAVEIADTIDAEQDDDNVVVL